MKTTNLWAAATGTALIVLISGGLGVDRADTAPAAPSSPPAAKAAASPPAPSAPAASAAAPSTPPSPEAPKTPAADATPKPTPKADAGPRSEAVIDKFSKGDYDGIYALFDATMKGALPKDQLKTIWEQLQAQVGAFKSHGKAELTTEGGYTVGLVPMTFERVELVATVAWNDKGEMSGLFFKPAPPKQSYAPPAYVSPASFTEKDVVAGAPGWPLPATLAIPVGAGPFPAAVLVHGSGPNDRDESVGGAKVFRDLAQGLASRGVAVLRYEKRTKQFGAKIASDHAPMTINEEVVDDAVAALALLRKTDRLDRSRMFVIGHSLGAMMAPEIARRDPSLAGIIAMAGPTRPIQVLLREQTAYILEKTGAPEQVRRDKLAELDAELAKIPSSKTAAGAAGAKGAAGIAGGTSATGEAGAANAAGAAGAGGPAGADGAGAWVLGASPEYWVSLQAYDPVATAKKIRTPLLIIQGERDYQVTMKDLDGWKAALAGKPGVDIRSYPKLNHLFVAGDGPSLPGEYDQPGHVAESVVADVAVWIKKQPPARLS